jgi:hypothetical protein
MIQLVSAFTFNVRDMARSVEFYQKLGFELLYGGESATFSSLKAGEAFVNLSANPGYSTGRGVVLFSELLTWTGSTGRSRQPGYSPNLQGTPHGVSGSSTSTIRTGTS